MNIENTQDFIENKLNSLATKFEVDNTFDSNKFIKLRLKVMHNKKSLHKITFKDKSIENAKKTLYNSPILAKVVFDVDKIPDFAGHEMHIEKTKDNKPRLIYDEIPIGIVPETSNYEFVEDEDGTQYVYVDAYVWKEYSNYAEDVITSRKEFALSMEVEYTDIRFKKEQREYEVYGYKYKGITFLGKKYTPAMQGAKASIKENFDIDENINKDNCINIDISKLNDILIETFSKYINKEMEGGFTLEGKEEKTIEITTDDNSAEKNDKVEVVKSDNTSNKANETFEQETNDESGIENDSIENNFEATFNSLREKASSSIRLLNRNSEDFYTYLVDMSDEYIYARECNYKTNSEHTYRYNYSANETNLSLSEDSKTEVIAQFITLDELSKLESDKNELYSLRVEKAENDKLDKIKPIFDKFDKRLLEVDEYTQLKSNFKDMTPEQIEDKCFAILGKQNFSHNETQINVVKQKIDTNFSNAKSTKYGGLLDEYYDKYKN